jgi:ribonuclease R
MAKDRAQGKQKDEKDLTIWDALGVHCSANERRADEASRDVEAWLKCFYMQDKLGEEFTGVVSGVTSFGIFVQLDELYVEGLVHVTELGGDYFQYDETRHELRGERTGKRFGLTDRVTVQIARVDLESRKIDLVLAGSPLPAARGDDKAAPRESKRSRKPRFEEPAPSRYQLNVTEDEEPVVAKPPRRARTSNNTSAAAKSGTKKTAAKKAAKSAAKTAGKPAGKPAAKPASKTSRKKK